MSKGFRLRSHWGKSSTAVLFASGFGVATLLACSQEDVPMPFERIFRDTAENSSEHGFVWVAHRAKEKFPEGRYDGGYDMQFQAALGVCRAKYKNGVHPGKIFGERCNIGWGGKEVVLDEFDTLVAKAEAFWHLAPKSKMDFSKALIGGHEQDGKPLYLCTAKHVTGWSIFSVHRGYHPGKYVAGKCNFGWGGEEVSVDDFFVLAVSSPDEPKGTSPPPAGGATCLNGEVACACKEFSGCSRPGYCSCKK